MDADKLEMTDPVRAEDGRVEWSIRTEKDGIGVVTDVDVDADAARAWALQLLTAAGPNTDEIVETWLAGAVRVTIEAPQGCEDVLDPSLFLKPRSQESFERILAAVGGVTAFHEPDGQQEQLRSQISSLGGVGDSMLLWLHLPQVMVGRLPKPEIAAMAKLRDQHREQSAQITDEQEAARRITADLIEERTLPGRLYKRLRELDRPVTVEELASVAMCNVDRARESVRHLLNAKLVVQSDEDPPMLTMAEGLSLSQSVGASLVEQLAEPASGGIVDDPLGPGPGKDGH